LTQLQGRFQQLVQADAQVDTQIQQWSAAQFAQRVAAEMPVLLEKIPRWKDPAKMKSDTAFMRTFLSTQGFSALEINTLADARLVSTALKAAKYDALMAKKGSRKLAGAPELAKPGTRALPGQAAATERNQFKRALATTSSDADKAKLILKRLERIV
jgi:hypothetical protein